MSKSLTDCLKDIGNEQITVNINGEEHTCSKTEAVARKMFVLAMGGYSEETNTNGEKVHVFHKANHAVAKMLREFMEGRPATEPEPEKEKNKKAGRFNSSISRRLNERLGPQRPK